MGTSRADVLSRYPVHHLPPGPSNHLYGIGGILPLSDNHALLSSPLVTQEVMRDPVNAMNGDIWGYIYLLWMSSSQKTVEPRKKW